VSYSVVFRFGSILRKDQSRFNVLRARCGHEHLTIRSAAECKDRLARSLRAIGYIVGRFGQVEDDTVHEKVTEENISKARISDLDVAEAFSIVLNLAKRSIRGAKAMTRERAREVAAYRIVEQFVVRLR
jgi:geranylgeranyl pyrophosphate synthase